MKRALLMIALLLVAVCLGTLLGDAAYNSGIAPWLGEYYEFGFSTFDLDLKMILVTFGMQIRINIAEVLLILTALACFPKVSKLICG
ncbi:MAG: DUF4321 domain-containing protein [Oscillospiraceae bacterium]|nr:DUF4321 domain-containing protein [Oscillospiraceae bacterium]